MVSLRSLSLQDPFWKFCCEKWRGLPKESQTVEFYDALACDCAEEFLTSFGK